MMELMDFIYTGLKHTASCLYEHAELNELQTVVVKMLHPLIIGMNVNVP